MLVALGINLSAMEAEDGLSPHAAKVLVDSQQLVQEMTREVRTLSYLLHPPLLDEAGLNSALRWYVEGFSKRSHVIVNLEVNSEIGRLPRETEMAIFRIVQECLTNVHRHSGSTFAEIRVERGPDSVRVEVQDEGRGIPPEKFGNPKSTGGLGIGITGMRERVRQLGGSLQIISNEGGTLIRAELPAPLGAVQAGAADSGGPSPT
jgi:signal transduction histidine kinase